MPRKTNEQLQTELAEALAAKDAAETKVASLVKGVMNYDGCRSGKIDFLTNNGITEAEVDALNPNVPYVEVVVRIELDIEEIADDDETTTESWVATLVTDGIQSESYVLDARVVSIAAVDGLLPYVNFPRSPIAKFVA